MRSTREKHPLKSWVARGPNGGVLWVKFWPKSVAVSDSWDSPGYVRPRLQPSGRLNLDGISGQRAAQREYLVMSQVLTQVLHNRRDLQGGDREVMACWLLSQFHFDIWQTYPEFTNIPASDQEAQ